MCFRERHGSISLTSVDFVPPKVVEISEVMNIMNRMKGIRPSSNTSTTDPSQLLAFVSNQLETRLEALHRNEAVMEPSTSYSTNGSYSYANNEAGLEGNKRASSAPSEAASTSSAGGDR